MNTKLICLSTWEFIIDRIIPIIPINIKYNNFLNKVFLKNSLISKKICLMKYIENIKIKMSAKIISLIANLRILKSKFILKKVLIFMFKKRAAI